MIRNADGSSKCAAFLRYVDRESAVQAIEMLNHSVVMDGATRPLIVKFADNKQQRQARQIRNSRRDQMLAVMRSGAPFPGFPVSISQYIALPGLAAPFFTMFLRRESTCHRCQFQDLWAFLHNTKYQDIHHTHHLRQTQPFMAPLMLPTNINTTPCIRMLICTPLTLWGPFTRMHTLTNRKSEGPTPVREKDLLEQTYLSIIFHMT